MPYVGMLVGMLFAIARHALTVTIVQDISARLSSACVCAYQSRGIGSGSEERK